ncbi:hypothetical protein GCM10023187_39160 [Nibrella viscosa]|uniref:histidine kinase n=2 Tax=Nibrella viscosa TaxID=1084524 RepID=A0ABP8KP30_9BACT
MGQAGKAGETGRWPIRFIHPEEYKAHAQNYTVTQDDQGITYVGNFAGVLEYDGTNWRQISTAQQTRVTAFGRNEAGQIFVGGHNDFGYLIADQTGQLQYKPLTAGIQPGFGEIHTVIALPEETYFFTKQKIFQWNAKTRTTREWINHSEVLGAWLCSSVIYVYQPGVGLGRLENGLVIPIRQGGRLASGVSAVLSQPDGPLVVTPNLGLFRLVGEELIPFSPAASQWVQNGAIRRAISLPPDRLALWSDKYGLLLMTSKGQLLQVSNYKDQLASAQVNNLFIDREGLLWLTLNKGLAVLNISSPISYFPFNGQIKSLLRYKNRLYVATDQGLFYVEKSSLTPFTAIPWACWSLAEAGGSLFVAGSNGLYQITDQQVRQLSSSFSFYVTRSASNPSRLYMGSESKLGQITLTGKGAAFTWLPIDTSDQSALGNITGIVDGGLGKLWLSTVDNHVFSYETATGKVRQYDGSPALQKSIDNHIQKTSAGLILYNTRGIFSYNPAKDRFEKQQNLAGLNTSGWYSLLVEDNEKNVWVTDGNQKQIRVYAKTQLDSARNAPLRLLADKSFQVVYPDTSRVVWLGGLDGLVRYDQSVTLKGDKPFPAFIREIRINSDSAFFRGIIEGSLQRQSVFASDFNNLTFLFSSASYLPGQEVEFQYMLDGFDEKWSEWSTQTKKEYSNLRPDVYTFRLRARNLYGAVSQETTYSFVIRTPIYQRWWAQVLYLVLAIVLLIAILRWRNRRSEKEKQALESLIQERTEEILNQKQELEQQSEELALKNDQLEKIDLIVQAINAEVNITSLFNTVLERLKIIRNMDSAAALIYDPEQDTFQFQAAIGIHAGSAPNLVQMPLNQAISRYLDNAVEVYEDVYVQNSFTAKVNNKLIPGMPIPKSMIAIVLKAEGRIEGFILIYNVSRQNAFDQRDFDTIRNVKEHLLAAYLKTQILRNLESTLENLKSTQEELIRQERLASVGQLTKGIVDRILNPLNYINNFSESCNDLIEEISDALDQHKEVLPQDVQDDVFDELNLLKNSLSKISDHGNSTTRIVKDMQKLLREKSRDFLETELTPFVESKALVALQEVKNEYKDLPIKLIFNLEKKPVRIRLLPFELGQVIANLISNACYALYEKHKTMPLFQPELTVSTKLYNGEIRLIIRDNGKGIPQTEIEKLFSPFFTTKPTSKGTGLGLFMSKDIVEMHKGSIGIKSLEGEYTEIQLTLPVLQGALV